MLATAYQDVSLVWIKWATENIKTFWSHNENVNGFAIKTHKCYRYLKRIAMNNMLLLTC